MAKKLLLSALFLILSLFCRAQHKGVVKGVLLNQQNKPCDYATVSVINIADSSVVQSTVAGQDGKFQIRGLDPGRYKIVAAHLGLQTVSKPFVISEQTMVVDLGTVIMLPATKNLKEVTVTAEKAPVTIKKDTIEFNAGSYKTQPNDNVEQLLKKLPGVDVDKDGNVTAQGKQVSKVMVDGKEFFGSDTKAATKNLPADAIDKVQVIDDKTEKTKNTGIDDGQRDKVLNLKLKDDKKSGWFGNISAEGGTDDRYLGQLNLNHFDSKRQFSLLFLSNNVNESGFTMEDLNNFAGGNIFDAFASSNGGITINVNSSGRANVNGAFNGVSGGLITNHTGGINYSDVFGKKEQLKFNANLVTVLSSNNLVETDNIQSPALNLLTNKNTSGTNQYNSYRLNLSFDYKADTLNSFKLKPSFSTSYTTTVNTQGLSTLLLDNSPVNQGMQSLNAVTHSPAIGGQFTYNHKFRGGKGSVNFYTNANVSQYKNNFSNIFNLYRYSNSTDSTSNLHTSQLDNASFINSTVSYIRRLSKKHKLNFTLSEDIQSRSDNANQATLYYNPVTGLYQIQAPSLSGIYDNTNWRYTSTAGLNKNGEKTTITVNAAVAELGLNGSFNGTQGSSVERNDWAFVPNASFAYRPQNGTNLFVSVRSDVTMPSVTDLQPILNTQSTTFKKIGNPDLNMSRNVSINANYSTFDFKTNNFINFYGNYTQIWDGFSTASYYDNTGVTTSKPINTDGNYTSNLGFNVGQPTRIKGLKISAGLNGSVNRTVNYINDNKNAVVRISPGISLGGNYDLDKLQLGLHTYTTYNNAKNSFEHVADQEYYSYRNSATISFKPFKSWRIYSDLVQTLYRGKPASANSSVYLWNAGIDRYFLKSQNLTLTLSAFDLLNQNSGISRSIATTGDITNTVTNTIGRYAYVKLTYKISKMGSANNSVGNNRVIIMR